MSRIRNNPKLVRIESFIAALHHEVIRQRLEAVGLTKGVIAEGEALSGRARRLIMGVPLGIRRTDLVARVNQWEQRVYPVVGASLRFEFPDVHDELFLGIQRGQGVAALPNVLTVGERLLDLAASTEARKKKAWALLLKRGVTQADVQAVVNLIQTGARFTITGNPRDEREEALAEAWKFYLVWSEIARSVIPEKALQRRMGVRTAKSAATPADPTPDPAPIAPEAPPPPPAVATVAQA